MSEGRAADEFFFILEKKNKYMWGGFQSVSCTISTTLSQTVEMNHLNIEAREVTFTCASWRWLSWHRWWGRLRLIFLSNRTEYATTRLLLKPAFRTLAGHDDWDSIAASYRQLLLWIGTRRDRGRGQGQRESRAADKEHGDEIISTLRPRSQFWSELNRCRVFHTRTETFEDLSYGGRKILKKEILYCYGSMMLKNRKIYMYHSLAANKSREKMTTCWPHDHSPRVLDGVVE